MNLSDTFYVALCMTVLILGAVYWFWTQNQFMLRKLNLLENIVYEMKMALSTDNVGGGVGGVGGVGGGVGNGTPSPVGESSLSLSNVSAPVYAPAPGSVMSDDDAEILNDDLHMTLSGDLSSNDFAPIKQESPTLEISNSNSSSSNLFSINNEIIELENTNENVNDDLQPGGVGSGIKETIKTGSSAYDGMTLKELRRLAENRGINGAKDMRKQALIDALRTAATSGTFNLTEGVLELN